MKTDYKKILISLLEKRGKLTNAITELLHIPHYWDKKECLRLYKIWSK